MSSELNHRRILTGGLVVALVFLAIEMAVEPLLAQWSEAWLTSLGLSRPAESAMLLIVLSGIVLGITTMWIYAALRARHGAGARTAVMVGIAVAVLVCLIPNLAMTAYGVLPPQLFLSFSAIALVQMPLATLAGARVYRDAAIHAPKASATPITQTSA